MDKICTVCKELKPLDNFYKRGSGYKSECMKCSRKASSNWKERNLSSIRQYSSRRTNEERIKWKQASPLKYLRSTAKHNAKKKNRDFDITNEQLETLWKNQNGLCYYTHQPMILGLSQDDSVSIDRKDSSKGYTKDNIVLCRYIVNIMKNDLSIPKLLEIVEQVLSVKQKGFL